jgi:hypothetical protein
MALRIRVPSLATPSVGTFTLVANGGVYAYSGNNANLLFNRALAADGGTYSYSGNNATLTYTTAGAFTLVADGGTYSYSGNNANLLVNRSLAANGGTYLYNGNNTTLTYTTAGAFVLSADGGVYSYAGNNSNLTFSGTPIIVDDTHDGDYLPRKFKRERDERNKRKRDIINAYEVLIEGRSPVIEELIAQYAEPEPQQTKAAKPVSPRLDIDKIMQSADAIERLWNAYIDMDDEEILLLL